MEEFYIRVKAPFAGYRYFQAGNYRITMPTMPHSAAYGLVLNLAGIEMRTGKDNVATLIKKPTLDFQWDSQENIPVLKIALGEICEPGKNSIYQQLHTYPVGNSSSHLAEGTKGAKYHILPTRREFLVNLDVIIGIKSEVAGFQERITDVLSGKYDSNRYGLPFAGDNNYLIDFIEIIEKPTETTFWYYPVQPEEIPETETFRLTIGIDRQNNHLTTMPVFAKTVDKSPAPPESAWVWTPSVLGSKFEKETL
ncbi:MAG: CRISPR-associated protein Cas5 [Spirochaetia bacterium]|nr:CRISPR-associated protein Cas5 [Spirochaetia bacterium]